MKNQKGIINITLVVMIIVIAAMMVGVAWWYENNKEATTNNSTVSNVNIETNTNSGENKEEDTATITTTIKHYEECVNAGFEILETDPPSCEAGGVTFTLERPQYEKDFIIGMTDERIIYNRGTMEKLLLADCEERGGTYNSCYMAPCETGACIQVCTPICDL